STQCRSHVFVDHPDWAAENRLEPSALLLGQLTNVRIHRAHVIACEALGPIVCQIVKRVLSATTGHGMLHQRESLFAVVLIHPSLPEVQLDLHATRRTTNLLEIAATVNELEMVRKRRTDHDGMLRDDSELRNGDVYV